MTVRGDWDILLIQDQLDSGQDESTLQKWVIPEGKLVLQFSLVKRPRGMGQTAGSADVDFPGPPGLLTVCQGVK